ncbi:pentatricopeptide repeat-containing protein [Pyrus ussuriensis x Pyrus communis]|uniref:Pentatricopeptide repeat-containing protein n=1 Tax=Pyrus ussuriensis x Pyrus communis TaxID=2448454 RepID=A0A5N5G7E6_9ROSA|nr:pentatricopeptide repeat-containing protein [Pyrus ussuriensis x Pyrus communis]
MLHKSLYGLKQAPRAWYDKLHGALLSLGFVGPSSSAYKSVICQLSALFPIKDLGSLHYFLGLEVKRSSKGIFVSQTKYILDLLDKAKMEGAKPCVTPLSTSQFDHSSPLLDDPTEYRSLVGALQYLTWTRPDLSFAVNLLWCDNLSAISLAKNPIFHARTKFWHTKFLCILFVPRIKSLTFVPRLCPSPDFCFSGPNLLFGILRLASYDIYCVFLFCLSDNKIVQFSKKL